MRPRVTRLALCVLVAGLLSGCVMGPNYFRPAVETPAAYQYEPKDVAKTADTEWWRLFGDPVLDQLIADALAHNKDVRIAAHNVEQAAAVLTQTRSALFPQVNYQANSVRERFSERGSSRNLNLLENPTTTHQVLAGASWELDLWGRVRRLSESAQASVLGQEAVRQGVVLSLVAQVATSYIQLRGLDEQLVIANRTLDAYGSSLKLTRDKFEFGYVSQMNVAQVQSQYETAAAKIPQIRSQIVLTENALAILLGRNPGSIPRGKSILELSLPAVPEGVPSQVLERRPDILAAEQQLISANAQIGAAKALYFPTISLTATLGSASRDLNNLFSSRTGLWSFAGNVVGPIFTAGSISGQIEQAEAAQRAGLAAYERAIQNSFADVENALVTREQLLDQLGAQQRLVGSLQEYSNLAHMLYDGGYTPYSTVLQAEQQLFPEELNLATNRAQLFASLVSIYRAMGGGWVVDAAGRAPQPVLGQTDAPKAN